MEPISLRFMSFPTSSSKFMTLWLFRCCPFEGPRGLIYVSLIFLYLIEVKSTEVTAFEDEEFRSYEA